MSATAGQTPHELSYLGRFARSGGRLARREASPTFRELMKRLKIGQGEGALDELVVGSKRPRSRRHGRPALQRRSGDRDAPPSRRHCVGWPEVAARARADGAERATSGGSTMRPGANSGASSACSAAARADLTGWAAELRFRQKASLLRVHGHGRLRAGSPRGRSAGRYLSRVPGNQQRDRRKAGGPRLARRRDSTASRTAARTKRRGSPSRRGQLDVVVFTVTESISLHRNEMPGGERARCPDRSRHAPQRDPAGSDRRPLPSRRRGGDDLLRLCRGHGRGAIAATVTRRMAAMEAMAARTPPCSMRSPASSTVSLHESHGMERSASSSAEQLVERWHLAELAQHDGILEFAARRVAGPFERHRAGGRLRHAARRALRSAG